MLVATEHAVKKWHVAILGGIISFLAILFITIQIDIAQLTDALTTARYIYVLPCMLLLLVGLVTRAERWRILLDGDLPLRRVFNIINIGYGINNFIPYRIGEVARIFLTSRVKPPIPMAKTTSTIITERLLDLLAVVVMALFALSLAPLPDGSRQTAFAFGVVAIVGFAVLIVLAWQRSLTEKLIHFFVERIPLLQRLPVEQITAQFLDGLAPLTRPVSLIGAFFWTAASWTVSCFAGYVLMFAFYDEASWATTLLYISSAAFAIAVPAVPGNLGTYELSILGAMSLMGYALDATATSFAVMVHAVNLSVHAATGIYGFVQEGVTWQQLSDGVNQMKQKPSDILETSQGH
ncbi:MAG: lysylphosphatidylglycerol synthase transmembrane domain-containing protein [Chloroflexota bacterium]